MNLIKAAILFLLLVSQQGIAQNAFDLGDDAFLFFIDGVNIEIIDQISDGCMPSPSSVEVAAEAELRRSGIEILSPQILNARFQIIAIGYGLDEKTCVIHLDAQLLLPIFPEIPYTDPVNEHNGRLHRPVTGIYHSVWIGNGVLSGPKTGIQSRIETFAREQAEKAFVRIARSKDRVRDNYPIIWYKYQNSKD